jgi:twitching motility protein PilJ
MSTGEMRTMTAAGKPRASTGPINYLAGAAALLIFGTALAGLYFANRAHSGPIHAAPALLGLAFDAQAAAAGEASARSGLEQHMRALRDSTAQDPVATLAKDARLQRVLANAKVVLDAAPAVADAAAAATAARELVTKLLAGTSALAGTLQGPSLDANMKALERFEVRAQRLQLDMSAIAQGAVPPGTAAQRLAENTDYLGQVVKGLQGTDTALGLQRPSGDEAEGQIAALAVALGELDAAVRRAVAAAPAPPAAQTAARAIMTDARSLAGLVPVQPGVAATGFVWWPAIPAAAGMLALAALWLGYRRVRTNAERQAASAVSQRKENDRNQQAILRLLDELSSLADGDLTVQATVTEDITGAIADSINFAVEALRGLVGTINGSALHLESATKQTQALAQHLAKASGAQSKQIATATDTAGAVAGLTEEVSNNAERASDVARHSVDIAHKGGDAVRRTIDGMNTIRETIQETSKRIKRLGESSQEIGSIVEVINDIAEQTNILALNASIQASMAGEAGRGFAVVADEVQRLAERAANATKQIEVLVRTIQTDTNEAVVSMERSTTDVVGGALLAENAGAALEEIEQVSNQIASLVQNISASSRQQTSAAQNIARSMQVLKEISSQTADSTNATSVAIAKLAELSAGLRKSASGFRLPGSQAPTAAQPPAVPAAKRPEGEKPPARLATNA